MDSKRAYHKLRIRRHNMFTNANFQNVSYIDKKEKNTKARDSLISLRKVQSSSSKEVNVLYVGKDSIKNQGKFKKIKDDKINIKNSPIVQFNYTKTNDPVRDVIETSMKDKLDNIKKEKIKQRQKIIKQSVGVNKPEVENAVSIKSDNTTEVSKKRNKVKIIKKPIYISGIKKTKKDEEIEKSSMDKTEKKTEPEDTTKPVKIKKVVFESIPENEEKKKKFRKDINETVRQILEVENNINTSPENMLKQKRENFRKILIEESFLATKMKINELEFHFKDATNTLEDLCNNISLKAKVNIDKEKKENKIKEIIDGHDDPINRLKIQIDEATKDIEMLENLRLQQINRLKEFELKKQQFQQNMQEIERRNKDDIHKIHVQTRVRQVLQEKLKDNQQTLDVIGNNYAVMTKVNETIKSNLSNSTEIKKSTEDLNKDKENCNETNTSDEVKKLESTENVLQHSDSFTKISKEKTDESSNSTLSKILHLPKISDPRKVHEIKSLCNEITNLLDTELKEGPTYKPIKELIKIAREIVTQESGSKEDITKESERKEDIAKETEIKEDFTKETPEKGDVTNEVKINEAKSKEQLSSNSLKVSDDTTDDNLCAGSLFSDSDSLGFSSQIFRDFNQRYKDLVSIMDSLDSFGTKINNNVDN